MTSAPAFRTAERRARGARPRLPSARAVLAEQIRATGLALRGAAVIAAAVVALATLAFTLPNATRPPVVDLYAWPTFLPGLLGALLPAAVWAREERFGSGFLWTLPVDRRRHALTRVLAGWVWLMGGLALFALWLLAFTLVRGGRVLPPVTLHVLTSALPAAGPLDPATLRSVRWAPGPLLWAVPFTAATASYLLASAFVLGSRHPIRWVIGAVLTGALASVVGEAASARLPAEWLGDVPGRVLQPLLDGRYGLDAVLTARTESLSANATLTTGALVRVWSAVPALADWRTATLLWTGVGLLALWAAASRHRERRHA